VIFSVHVLGYLAQEKEKSDLKIPPGLCLSLANKTRGRTVDICRLCVHCVTVQREGTFKLKVHIICFHDLREIKKQLEAVILIIRIKSGKELKTLCHLAF
jgi:hypothetical protein